MSAVATVSPEEVQARRASGPVALIDVRSPAEFRAVHAEGATLVPLEDLDARAVVPAGPVYLICETGPRAFVAAERLRAAGRSDVAVVDGGTVRWEASGLPVVRGPKTWSMFRQVRLVAGLLVLTGVGLGWFVHPGFYGLAGFVGAGLAFSAVTDFCGMALLLARCPWNK